MKIRTSYPRYLILSTMLILAMTPNKSFSKTVTEQLKSIRSLENAGLTDAALGQYESLFKKYSQNRLVFIYYKRLLLKTEQYQKALNLCEQAEELFPQYEPELACGQVLYRMGKIKDAKAHWDSLFHVYGNRKEYIHAAASLLIEERLYGEAIEIYKKGAQNKKFENDFTWNISNLYITLRKYDKAVESLLVHLKKHPKQFKMVQSQINRFPKKPSVYLLVQPILKKESQNNSSNSKLSELLYEFEMKYENFEAGFEWVKKKEALLDPKEQGVHYFAFGQIAASKKAYDIAEKSFRAILNLENPFKEQTVRHFLARNYAEQQKWKEANRAYRILISNFETSIHWPNYLFEQSAVLENLKSESDSVQFYLNQILRHPKTKPDLRLRTEAKLSQYFFKNGAFEEAESLMNQRLSRVNIESSEWLPLWVERAHVIYFKNDLEKVKMLLDTLKTTDVIQRYSGHNSMNDGLNLYWKTVSHLQFSKEDQQLFVEAESAFHQKKYRISLVLLDSVLSHTKNNNMKSEAWFLKGDVLTRQNKIQQSVAVYDSIWAHCPEHRLSDQALEKAGALYEKTEDKIKAISRYEKLIEKYPKSLWAEEVRERLRYLEENK